MSKLHSPKNKFRGEFHFNEAQEGIGSVVSYSANTVEELKSFFSIYTGGTVSIFENKAQYPSFDWEEVDRYIVL